MTTLDERARVASALGQRWWTSPRDGRRVLEAVAGDPGDVAQAVGSAVLGYHAIALGELGPLARRTLVDATGVGRALGQIDLAPVAKALAAATRPIMGPAADRYGELLADDLHQHASEATDRLIFLVQQFGLQLPEAWK